MNNSVAFSTLAIYSQHLSSSKTFFFKHLYWSIIALQWCVSFCFITKWISYTYTHIPISPTSCVSSHPPYPTPLVVTKHRAELLVLCSCFPLAIYLTIRSVYLSMPLSHFLPPSPSPSLGQVHSLHLHLYSWPAPRFFRTIFFFF